MLAILFGVAAQLSTPPRRPATKPTPTPKTWIEYTTDHRGRIAHLCHKERHVIDGVRYEIRCEELE